LADKDTESLVHDLLTRVGFKFYDSGVLIVEDEANLLYVSIGFGLSKLKPASSDLFARDVFG